MEKNARNVLSKIFSNNWVITFTSTILGVFLALYLSDYYNSKSLLEAKDDAFSQVRQETGANHENLIEYQEALIIKFKALTYLSDKLNPEMEIIIHKDSLNAFRSSLGDFFALDSLRSTLIGKDSMLVKGDFDFQITAKLVVSELQTVLWDTYKQTDYLSLTDFGCISNIETIYTMFKDFNHLNAGWRDAFFRSNFLKSQGRLNTFLIDWRNLLLKQQLLIALLDNDNGTLSDCY